MFYWIIDTFCLYIYIWKLSAATIYIYIQREREKERVRKRLGERGVIYYHIYGQCLNSIWSIPNISFSLYSASMSVNIFLPGSDSYLFFCCSILSECLTPSNVCLNFHVNSVAWHLRIFKAASSIGTITSKLITLFWAVSSKALHWQLLLWVDADASRISYCNHSKFKVSQ